MKGLVWQDMLSAIIAYGAFEEAYGCDLFLGQVCSLLPQLVCCGDEPRVVGRHEQPEHVVGGCGADAVVRGLPKLQ
jgi:hypothetical protein|tara:strand:+ start:417 stop:644 length:228 start_codon:yes stop_codon:yes gene_type:complete